MTHPTYPLRALALEDYAITGLDAVMTPALVIYPEYVDNNIAATLRVLGGDRNRFRPHIKTAKLISVMRQYVGHDITRFKCATTLELLALIEAGARDVLLSYPLVGAGARRLRAITDAHPNVVISGLVENVEQLRPYAGSRVGVFIDINPGMDRTGLGQERIGDALAIVRAARDLGIAFRGLHYYDGHLARHPMPERTQHAHAGYEVLLTMARALQADGHGIGEIITSGTPAFPCSATFEPFAKGEGWVHRASPGTTVFYDINTYGSRKVLFGTDWPVIDPQRAIIQVEDYYNATSQLAQTTLRSVLGQHELDEMLAGRDELNRDIQNILDSETDVWGIKVSNVEIKRVDLDESMVRAIARQAEAERERRAKVINAEGEFQAAERIRQAAEIIASQPQALQLRYLQTLNDIGIQNNTTVVFPVPLDLFEPLLETRRRGSM